MGLLETDLVSWKETERERDASVEQFLRFRSSGIRLLSSDADAENVYRQLPYDLRIGKGGKQRNTARRSKHEK